MTKKKFNPNDIKNQEDADHLVRLCKLKKGYVTSTGYLYTMKHVAEQRATNKDIKIFTVKLK
jgi:hypothetical protein